MNKALRLMCVRDSKCRSIDVNPAAIYKNYKNDGIHFNYTGTKFLAKQLADKIASEQTNFPLTKNHPPL